MGNKTILYKLKLYIFSLLVLTFFLACSKADKLEPGIYVNYKYNFSFEFPKDWVKGHKIPGTNIHLTSPDKTIDLVLSIYNSYTGLNETPEEWINYVYILFPELINTDLEIMHKKNITLNDGTPAVKAGISWMTKEKKKLGFTSLLGLNIKNKRIIFQSTSIQGKPFEEMDRIVNSFRFNDDPE